MNLLDSVLLEQFTHEGLLRTSSLLPVLCEPAIAVTGAITASVDRMYLCSGTTADYTMTLPAAAANAGHFVGFRMDSALTKIVTIDGNASELIDDVTARRMWKGENAVLYCDGTGWVKVMGRIIPMIAKASMAQAVNCASGVTTKLAVTGTTYDNSTLINTGSGRIDIKRYGTYTLMAGIGQTNVAGTNPLIYLVIYVNGATYLQVSFYKDVAQSYPVFYITSDTVLSAGDYVELYVVHYAGSDRAFDGISLSVSEIPQW